VNVGRTIVASDPFDGKLGARPLMDFIKDEILEVKLRLIACAVGVVPADRALFSLRLADPILSAEAMSRSR